MIVDSSALVAIVFQEPEWERLVSAVTTTSSVGIGTPTLVETGIVLSARLGRDAEAVLARLVRELELVPVPFGERHWHEAVQAFGRYGRGRHRAALNFGDCLTYAVASLADEPLLYVGTDFAATDLRAA